MYYIPWNTAGICSEYQPSCAYVFGVAGLTHIITVDLHQKEIQGFFNFPVDNLRASPFLIQYIQEEVSMHYTVLWHIVTTVMVFYCTSVFRQYLYLCKINGPLCIPALKRLFLFLQIPDYRNAIIVAKSPSAAKR